MAITGVNQYATYANYYTQTKPKDSSENTKMQQNSRRQKKRTAIRVSIVII